MTEKILDRYITTALLGSGHAAVNMVLIKDDDDEAYWDVQQTGIGRYKTRKEAEVEAQMWAKTEGIRYK